METQSTWATAQVTEPDAGFERPPRQSVHTHAGAEGMADLGPVTESAQPVAEESSPFMRSAVSDEQPAEEALRRQDIAAESADTPTPPELAQSPDDISVSTQTDAVKPAAPAWKMEPIELPADLVMIETQAGRSPPLQPEPEPERPRRQPRPRPAQSPVPADEPLQQVETRRDQQPGSV